MRHCSLKLTLIVLDKHGAGRHANSSAEKGMVTLTRDAQSPPRPSLHADTSAASDDKHNKVMLYAKWAVYSLLVVNFGLYITKDITAAQHTINAATTLTGWINAFVASTEQFAWVALIIIYEIETYWLEDDFDNKLIEGLMLAGKLVFAFMILNTIISYTSLVLEIYKIKEITPAGGLCDMAGQGLAFLRNLAYTPITAETCDAIEHAGGLFRLPTEPVLTDALGVTEDSAFRWLDLIEATSWFAILGLTELSVRLQNRGIHEGLQVKANRVLKTSLYIIIGFVALFWLLKGHYMYVWDEFLWIASFVALDGNLSAWRDELADDGADNTNSVDPQSTQTPPITQT